MHPLYTLVTNYYLIIYLLGWRDETYTVFDGFFNSKKLFDIERAAVPILSCKLIFSSKYLIH